ncbi:MAG: zinc ribbon domain-containing protein [Bacillota bacterium]
MRRGSEPQGDEKTLGYKDLQCAKTGAAVVEIPRFYSSSKTCFYCGHVLDDLSLTMREWTCPVCSAKHDRDLNAARNIFRVGASDPWGEGVRPASAGVLP